MKRCAAILMAGLLTAGALTACAAADDSKQKTDGADTQAVSESDGGASSEKFQIGVIQFTEHAALDSAYQGFEEGLKEAGLDCDIELISAQNDQSTCTTIATKFVNDGKDLILAIATPAAQAVAGQTEDIPILVTAVTDPASAGLVNSNEEPGCNVSGTSDATPVEAQIELLQQLIPDAKTVGVLYCSAEQNSEFQLEQTRQACEAAGLELEEFSVSSTNEIQQVTESMVGKVDVIYTFTDNTISANMPTVTMIATENGIPCIVGEEGMVDGGGLATYGINYETLGKMTAKQAVRILKDGEDISKMPIEFMSESDCELKINEEAAKELGITIPKDLIAQE